MYKITGLDGREYGPVDFPTLERWVLEGRVRPTTPVLDPITGVYRPASEIAELSDVLHRAAAANPSQPSGPATPPPGSPPPTPTGYPRSVFGAPGTKSRVVALLLWFFVGGLGIHRFYLGHNETGIGIIVLQVAAMIAFCTVLGIPIAIIAWVGLAIWWVLDGIWIATGTLADAKGLPYSE